MHYLDLMNFVKRVGELYGVPSSVKLHAIVTNIIDETATTAVKIHLGYIDKDALTPKMVYQSACSLMFHLMGVDVWLDSDREQLKSTEVKEDSKL